MELDDVLLKMKESLAKFSTGRMLHIAEAAEELKVTEKYLAGLARKGKIKAFKIGEDWFMEEKWIKDFRLSMKSVLADEISSHKKTSTHHKGWTKHVPARHPASRLKTYKPAFSFAFQTTVAAIALVVLGTGFALMCLPLAEVGMNRVAIADKFITGTFAVYSWPAKQAQRISFDHPINDEKLTDVFYRLAGKNPPGQVAGAFEKAEIK